MDILYGRNPVREALRSGRPARKLVLAEGVRTEDRLTEILETARERNIPVETGPRRRLDDIAHSDHHQGIAGYFHSRAPLDLEDLLERCGESPVILVLDGIQDPHNLGALTRTADAAGVDGIIIPRHRAASVTPSAAKASAGATEHVPIASVANIVQALTHLADIGYRRIGLDAAGDSRYDQLEADGPLALIVGSEGEGMRPLTRKQCDVIVSIPMAGRVSSLNATVAGSLLLYEVARRRGFPRRETSGG